jgi:uncharacterized membrane protein YhaH (DUF805 family)
VSEFDQNQPPQSETPPSYQQTPPQYGQQQVPPQYGQQQVPPQYGQQQVPPQYGQQQVPPQYGQQQVPPQYGPVPPPVYIPGEQRMAGFWESYRGYWRNYANFNDRTSRAGYWWVVLANFIIGIILGIIMGVTMDPVVLGSSDAIPFAGFGIVYYLWGFANIIPGLAIFVRRLHDINKPWTWIFMGLIPIVGGIILIVYAATGTKYVYENRWLNRPQVEKLV